jgi:hypothetical protein
VVVGNERAAHLWHRSPNPVTTGRHPSRTCRFEDAHVPGGAYTARWTYAQLLGGMCHYQQQVQRAMEEDTPGGCAGTLTLTLP